MNQNLVYWVDNKMYIIGGWPWSSNFASNDIYVLDLDTYIWSIPQIQGSSSPVYCNLHSTDLVGRVLYIFRGGNGQEYLNDMHSYDIGKT
jgi:hypothetical protein